MRRLLHLSDLHFGRTDHAAVEAIHAFANATHPHLIAVSGDLTQRARRSEFEAAARFFTSLPAPVLAVPGNHDVPLYHFAQRLTQPLRGFREHILDDPDPIFVDSEMIVAGVNTATRWRWKEGRVRDGQIARLSHEFTNARLQTKVLVMHHPPADGLWQFRKALGVRPDLILSGHLHRSAIEIHDECGVILLSAGTSTSTRLRGDANSFNLIDIEPSEGSCKIRIESRLWNGHVFSLEADERYCFSGERWERIRYDSAAAPSPVR